MFFKLLEGVLDRPQLAMYSNIPWFDKACLWSVCESTKTKCISSNLIWLDWFKWFRFKLRWVKYKASVCSPWNNKIWIQNKMIHPCIRTVVHHKCFTFIPSVSVSMLQILLKKREPLNYLVPDGSAGFSSRLAASQDMMTFSPPSVRYYFILREVLGTSRGINAIKAIYCVLHLALPVSFSYHQVCTNHRLWTPLKNMNMWYNRL